MTSYLECSSAPARACQGKVLGFIGSQPVGTFSFCTFWLGGSKGGERPRRPVAACQVVTLAPFSHTDAVSGENRRWQEISSSVARERRPRRPRMPFRKRPGRAGRYALWITIEPPEIACGSAVSMSIGTPFRLSKTTLPPFVFVIRIRNLSVPPPPVMSPS